MPFSLTWLPDVLKIAGLKVSEVPGWRDRGRGDVGRIFGVMCHHTAGPKSGNMPSLNVLVNGRAGLPGPLSQLGLGRDGTYYIIAAGRANHAGRGEWRGLRNGNSNFIGIEAENTGRPDDPWPNIQIDAYHRGVAAILKRVGQSSDFCTGHKEYALPKGRKPDPSFFNMDEFRASIAAIMSGAGPEPRLIPAVEPTQPASNTAPRPTLRRGMAGDLTREIQRKLGVTPTTGNFGPKTEAAVRALQRKHGLVGDGIVGPRTWRLLDQL
ncbi:MAG TPA: N-acetylmuramoyl-L-alanine amidase [Pyrinomonadaceae bacterium]|nr:N-acetylmuramoyl-L-alanine amidase [Pyrinomonadaceae bacterium]